MNELTELFSVIGNLLLQIGKLALALIGIAVCIAIIAIPVFLLLKTKDRVEEYRKEKELEEMKPILDYQAKQIAVEMSKLKENNNDSEETHYIQESEE